MVGVEIDLVVTDTLAALELYEKIFEVERNGVTNFPKGLNEVIFTLYGTRFHMLDENEPLGLIAPKPGQAQSIWFNIIVPDIKETCEKAMGAGCVEIQPVTELPDYGVSNAILADPFGYAWMLHQIHREVSFEERVKLAEDMLKAQD